MSYVRPNITSPSYWTFMAHVMVKRLKIFIERRYVDGDEIPRGVLQEAKNFFSLALDEKLENPEESANVGAIAAHVMPQVHLLTLDQFNAKLKHYADFLNQIGQRRALDGVEAKTAEELLGFFASLKRFGEEIRSYEQVKGRDYWPEHGTQYLLALAGG